MNKPHRTSLVLFLVIVQIIFAITAGTAAIFAESLITVPTGVDIGGLSVGNMSYDAASKQIDAAYSDKMKSSSIQLQMEDGTVYEVPFSKIDAQIDPDATIESVKKVSSISELPALLNSYFSHSKHDINPIITFDEGKLRLALIEISEKLQIEPVNARISCNKGVVEKTAEKDGLKLNVTNTVNTIKKQLSEDPWSVIKLERAKNYELETVLPDIGLKDYDDIQVVLSEYKTYIIDDELKNGINAAIASINGVILNPRSQSDTADSLSLVERLTEKSTSFNNDDEGYDQVASTLYAAILLSGLPEPKNNITRMAHKLAVDYIEPGLDAWISGNGGDLKFTNSFSKKIAVFAEIEDGYIKVMIAGSIADKNTYELRTEIVQKFSPTVYYVENRSLKSGERVTLTSGRDGMLVNVYRNEELISNDKYDAEKSIVQIGPNTQWDSDNGK